MYTVYMANKIIIGVFAHPDDEAFGPSGTLLKEVRAGADLHLITLTSGDAGQNPDKASDLGEVRLREWHKAGELLGAKTMRFLGYSDGQLDNLSMIEIAKKIKDISEDIISSTNYDTLVEFISLDTNGLSGHIDHIVAARATLWAFYRLKEQDSRFNRVRLACLSEEDLPTHNTNWLYMEKGRSEAEISEVVDAREFREEIVEIIRAHHSQRGDGEAHLKTRIETLGLDYFIVKQ